MGAHASASTLSALAACVPGAEVLGDAEIEDLAYDSRLVAPGSLFYCVPGERHDGHDHAETAAAAGAAALVAERRVGVPLPQAIVPSVRAAMGPTSAAFFGHPSRSFRLAGVTGTNGKTTTTFLLERAFEAAGMRSAIVGTVETRVAGETLPAVRTTPEAPDLQRLFARMRAAGVGGAAIEVSSHGLALHRADGSRFACAVFTNLTQDHLDFHGDMERYFAAKARLFDPVHSEVAAINVDDPFGRRLVAAAAIPVVTFGFAPDARVRAVALRLGPEGARFRLEAGGEGHEARLRLTGRYNVSNALAAAAAFVAMGLPIEAALEGAASLAGVPGRVERIEAGQDFAVLVDYAHTPDSLENVLRAAREIVRPGARLVCVFGCGGDRDRSKRPLMGRVACSLADRAIITSDNPRSEDPAAIIAEIEAGARAGGGPYELEPDRRSAIERAVREARSGDVVVIAGKGHETGQQLADRTIPFDDRGVVREVLGSLAERAP